VSTAAPATKLRRRLKPRRDATPTLCVPTSPCLQVLQLGIVTPFVLAPQRSHAASGSTPGRVAAILAQTPAGSVSRDISCAAMPPALQGPAEPRRAKWQQCF